jgi:preprotein translocase subunit SecG
MTTVLLVIHLLIAIALVITVLLQPSEGGGLGLGSGGGGGGGGLGGFLSGRGTANALTRTTAVLAAFFMATSIALTIFAGGGQEGSILDELPAESAPDATGSGDSMGTGTGSSGDATQPQPDEGGGSQSPEVPLE